MVNKVMAAEVAWYRQHGRYPERIVRSKLGEEYVVGDWWWNARHPEKPEWFEPPFTRFANSERDRV